MPLLLIAPPALVAQAPQARVVPQVLDPLQELFEAIPEALIDGKRGAMRGLVAKAKAGWDHVKPDIRKAMPEPEVIAAVIGVQDALKRFQESRQKHHMAGAKKALKDLLDLVDALEKP